MVKKTRFFSQSCRFSTHLPSPGRRKVNAVPGPINLLPLQPSGGSPGSSGDKWRQTLGVLMSLSAVGIEMGAAIGIGVGLGYYLDLRLATGHWLLLFFGICGFIAAGRALARLIRRVQQPLVEEGEDEKPPERGG
jgi:F0F1-type ATP synthase assembly protein I